MFCVRLSVFWCCMLVSVSGVLIFSVFLMSSVMFIGWCVVIIVLVFSMFLSCLIVNVVWLLIGCVWLMLRCVLLSVRLNCFGFLVVVGKLFLVFFIRKMDNELGN